MKKYMIKRRKSEKLHDQSGKELLMVIAKGRLKKGHKVDIHLVLL